MLKTLNYHKYIDTSYIYLSQMNENDKYSFFVGKTSTK